jgi:flagellin-like hook-associated protein FlgL
MPRRAARTAAVLAVAALFAGGCGTVEQVTGTVDNAANTVQVCTTATSTMVGTFARVSDIAANARPGQLQDAQAQIAAEFQQLHARLKPLIDQATDTDVKAQLTEVDQKVTAWAANPQSFRQVDKATVDALVAGLRRACGPS